MQNFFFFTLFNLLTSRIYQLKLIEKRTMDIRGKNYTQKNEDDTDTRRSLKVSRETETLDQCQVQSEMNYEKPKLSDWKRANERANFMTKAMAKKLGAKSFSVYPYSDSIPGKPIHKTLQKQRFQSKHMVEEGGGLG